MPVGDRLESGNRGGKTHPLWVECSLVGILDYPRKWRRRAELKRASDVLH